VLFQLCDLSHSHYDIISDFYSTHRDGAQNPSDDDLVRRLKDLLKQPGQAPVYLIIDALDECSDTYALSSPHAKVLAFVKNLVDEQLSNLRICITSRPEIDILVELQPLSFRSISIHEERGHKEDIEKYIKSTIESNIKMQQWAPEDKQLVIDALSRRADGM
jgi:hypothetical protein